MPGLVGRAAQVAALNGWHARARAGESVLVLIEGEAGIGKTTLVSSWSNGLHDEALVISGRCDELGRDLPLQPILDGLEAHLRTIAQSDIQAVLAEAEPVLGPLLGRFNAAAAPGPTTVADAAAGGPCYLPPCWRRSSAPRDSGPRS